MKLVSLFPGCQSVVLIPNNVGKQMLVPVALCRCQFPEHEFSECTGSCSRKRSERAHQCSPQDPHPRIPLGRGFLVVLFCGWFNFPTGSDVASRPAPFHELCSFSCKHIQKQDVITQERNCEISRDAILTGEVTEACNGQCPCFLATLCNLRCVAA